MTLYDRVVSPLDARPELISCATENEIFDMLVGDNGPQSKLAIRIAYLQGCTRLCFKI